MPDKKDKNRNKPPIGKAEDVEFSMEEADQDDFEAYQRAKSADNRQEKKS
ncbi:YfhD family protein [Caldalkalibacillus salinus]|nr:YfhD family protein [Caldalkalibacillus salinus]